jgi:phosphoribosylanthranilate isomerase
MLGGVAVKACGIMRVEHAVAAAASGASMVGVVFARSKRNVTVGQAIEISEALDRLERRPLFVGVFVNEMPRDVLAIADQVGLDVVQLSGDETPLETAECASRYAVLKALRFPVGTPVRAALEDFARYREYIPGESLRFVVDTFREGEYGGTGKLGDWGIAAELAVREKIVLAGGLTPQNVGRAIREVRPWGVDVSSGIERDGMKDSGLIEMFIRNAQQL